MKREILGFIAKIKCAGIIVSSGVSGKDVRFKKFNKNIFPDLARKHSTAMLITMFAIN